MLIASLGLRQIVGEIRLTFEHADRRQISGSKGELSHPLGEFMFSVCLPELRVTAGWPAGDEIRAPCPSSFFRRAFGTPVR
jgi:hypothetical protein